MSFVHLHLNTEYSLLYGECRVSDVVTRAAERGFRALAITDRNALFGAVGFSLACRNAGVKPIIGCECFLEPKGIRSDSLRRLTPDDCSVLVLIVTNAAGYRNLSALLSLAHLRGAGVPCVDVDMLASHSEGLIALSGGPSGEIHRCVKMNDLSAAHKFASDMKRIFGGRFYIELQRHGEVDGRGEESVIISLAHGLDIDIVATNGVLYTDKSGARTQRMLDSIAKNTQLSYGDGDDSRYLKTDEEMESLFADLPEAIINTEVISDSVDFDFEFGVLHLPSFQVPEESGCSSGPEYLRMRYEKGFAERFGESDQETLAVYRERGDRELEIINEVGFANYYLIVDDFVAYAKRRGIPVGPGRGSGVGSLVAFCLGITDVDPIKNALLFERFLNPERVSMPDFDIDFCYDRRGEVIDYVSNKYGRDRVAQIVTFGTLAPRAAVRDAARILGLSREDTDRIARLTGHPATLFGEGMPDKLREAIKDDPQVASVVETAMLLEGRPRHCSTHATGVVITDRPVSEYMPLALNGDVVVTQYTMEDVARLGLLKIDFLGLRYLTIIHRAEELIRKSVPGFSVEKVSLNDEKTYQLLQEARTEGVFQLESGGMKRLLKKLAPETFDDITLAISLYRPGPMDSIPECLENRRDPSRIKYKISTLAPILAPTYGCIIYQEQVMQICREVGGFTYGRADVVRRAMAKKKHNVMEAERDAFLAGASERGYEKESACELWNAMSEFARYAFNKSHAAAYAVTSYRTAYLKAHYPKEYFCALLGTVIGVNDKVAEYAEDALQFGVRLKSPDINRSDESFSVEDDCIRFGLLCVKNVGVSFVRAVLSERSAGEFTSFENFMLRMSGSCNVRMLESLIRCGTFDSFGTERSRLLAVLPEAIGKATAHNDTGKGQLGLFGDENDAECLNFDYPDLPELSFSERLRSEKELTGVYISGHPLENYANCLKYGTESLAGVLRAVREGTINDGAPVKVLCLIVSVRSRVTKKGEPMAVVCLGDEYAECEAVVFPKQYSHLSGRLQCDRAVVVNGTVRISEDNAVTLGISDIKEADNDGDVQDIYIRVTDSNCRMLEQCLKTVDRGNCEVFVWFENEKRLARAKGVMCSAEESSISKMSELMGADNIRVTPRKSR